MFVIGVVASSKVGLNDERTAWVVTFVNSSESYGIIIYSLVHRVRRAHYKERER